ncbi:hypothetical protein ACN6K5_000913 [Streptomyces violaceoruber]|uniref:RNA polymerase subunit sigma-70 n=1 Tax=Streptomyces violaceoruber TaxID=1935 RepID=UPI00403C47C7
MTAADVSRIALHLETARKAVLAELDSIPDPVQREAVAREALRDLVPALGRAVQTRRTAAVAELKEGRTLAQVGDLLGVSTARVDQILKGK